MTYIYDILLNFTDSNYYEIYEWETKDNIVNIKKVPVFRITSKNLYDIINHRIRINIKFLDVIKNKNIISKKYIQPYVTLFSNGYKSIGIVFDKKGNIIYKSSLLFGEEKEVNKVVINMKNYNILYKKIYEPTNEYLRSDLIKIKYIKECVRTNYKKKNYQLLRYVFYDIFEKNESNIDTIYNNLVNIDCYIDKINKVYIFFKYNNKLIEK